jgi:UDP-N-acetylmuramoyl-tripeptide--D-alanyl-D-alanine ligase
MIPISAMNLLKSLWPAAPEELTVTSVVTDSREVRDGCVFVAIKGERVDGHDFAAGALRDGAAVVVAERLIEGVPAGQTVLVANVLDAMIEMGANYRAQFSPLLLGITGSVGKTTTKEFCAAVFSAFDETLKTEGNQNNEIGLPKTLFRLDDAVRYAVVEMGAQAPGDIHKLSMAAAPAAAVVTKIGASHMATMGSIENVLQAKMEICDGLAAGSPLVLNGDDALLLGANIPDGLHVVFVGVDNEDCEVRAKNIRREGEGQYIIIQDSQYGAHEAYIPALGRHYVDDALLAYTAATRMGLAPAQVAVALSGYCPAAMRQNIADVNGVTVIEDCYNASPESMQAALQTLGEMQPGQNGRRIAAIGDMLELGSVSDEAHRAVAHQSREAGVELLLAVGPQAALAVEEAEKIGVQATLFETNKQMADELLRQAKAGDVVLVKASRGMKLEEVFEQFSENFK